MVVVKFKAGILSRRTWTLDAHRGGRVWRQVQFAVGVAAVAIQAPSLSDLLETALLPTAATAATESDTNGEGVKD